MFLLLASGQQNQGLPKQTGQAVRCELMGHIAKFCQNLVAPTLAFDQEGSADKWAFEAGIEGKEIKTSRR